MKRLSLPAAVAALAAAFALLTAPGSALAATETPLAPPPPAFPAAFTATPTGARILSGERLPGRIRSLTPITGTSAPFFPVPNVASAGDQGLLGLALHPSYPGDRRVWAFVT